MFSIYRKIYTRGIKFSSSLVTKAISNRTIYIVIRLVSAVTSKWYSVTSNTGTLLAFFKWRQSGLSSVFCFFKFREGLGWGYSSLSKIPKLHLHLICIYELYFFVINYPNKIWHTVNVVRARTFSLCHPPPKKTSQNIKK